MRIRNLRRTAVAWIVGICVVAAAPVLTACSANSTKPNGASGSPSDHQTVSGAPPAKEDPSSKDASSSPKEGSGGQPTAQKAVAKWVTAIVQDRPMGACRVMATPASGSSSAKPNTAETCGGDSPQAQQTKKSLDPLHRWFTPEQPKNPPSVKVAKTSVSNGTTTVDGEQVTVDGQTLKAVVFSHSSGVTEDEISIKITASEIDGRWYVADLHFSAN